MEIIKEIGGYFNLELRNGTHYHKDALRFNTCRNCLEYIIRVKRISRIYMPIYTCDVVYEPAKRLNVCCNFYHVDEQLNPVEIPRLNEGEAFLYTNYFGLKQNIVRELFYIYGERLIVDNAQAFFADHIEGVNTYYAARKFLGVADGAYMYTSDIDESLLTAMPYAMSFDRMSHLLKRYDLGANGGYADFKINDYCFEGMPMQKMSHLTDAILRSLDYEFIKNRRRRNYEFLASKLDSSNILKLCYESNTIPMVYPYRTSNAVSIRSRLLQHRIYTSKYWPDIYAKCKSSDEEYVTVDSIIPIPIDQRYGEEEMKRVVEVIIN